MKRLFIGLFVFATAFQGIAAAQSSKDQGMIRSYLNPYVIGAAREHQRAYDEIKTTEDVAAYQQKMREFFLGQIGGMPEKTPLNPEITGTIDRDGFRIEKVVFESRPGMHVTALMYVPDGEGPFPAVLVPCGHSNNGKASEFYQRGSILMAQNGLAVLCYDPIGQGERYQHLRENGAPAFSSTIEHTYVDVGATLLGIDAATWRIWDGIRAIDYLVSRDDVDASKIGCAGNSGGGTMTAYLGALDDRIVCAAPSCYITSMGALLNTIGPQDGEQTIYRQVKFGMGHAEYLIMRAPKPTLICCATEDFFDIHGTWDTYRRAKRVYGRLGFGERMALVETDNQHGWHPQLREATARWMSRWLLGVDEAIVETEAPILSDEEALCTPEGQVMLLDGERSVFDEHKDLAATRKAEREALWADTAKEEIFKQIVEMHNIRPGDMMPPAPLGVQKVNDIEGLEVFGKVFNPEPGVRLYGAQLNPPNPDENIYVYLDGRGSEEALREASDVKALALEGHVVFVLSLRGTGNTESRYSSEGWWPHFGPDWQDIALGLMVGKPMIAMRTDDVFSIVNTLLIAKLPGLAENRRIHVIATGEAGPPAIHAVALNPEKFASLTLKGGIRSWHDDVIHNPLNKNQYVNAAYNALAVYDLPDLIATLPEGMVKFED